MNDITPVGRITSMLLEAGYRSVSTPLVIGGLKFDFPAALVGTDHGRLLVKARGRIDHSEYSRPSSNPIEVSKFAT